MIKINDINLGFSLISPISFIILDENSLLCLYFFIYRDIHESVRNGRINTFFFYLTLIYVITSFSQSMIWILLEKTSEELYTPIPRYHPHLTSIRISQIKKLNTGECLVPNGKYSLFEFQKFFYTFLYFLQQ